MSRNESGSIEVRLAGLQPGDRKPVVALYLIGPKGVIESKIGAVSEDRLTIPAKLPRTRETILALGPDSPDPSTLNPGALFQVRGDQIASWEAGGLVTIPRSIWFPWPFWFACVSGKVQKCPWIIWDQPSPGYRPIQFPPFPWRCAPICNGVVEVYEQRCCCRLLYEPIDLAGLIAALREYVVQFPPIPIPGPGPDPFLVDRELAYNIKVGQATAERTNGGLPGFDAVAEIEKLQSYTPEEATVYVRGATYLWPFICSCESRLVGETVLGPGGDFSFCYFRFPFFEWPWLDCSFSYAYKVKQWNGTGWDYVYDGVALRQYFMDDSNALITTFLGQACDPGSPVGSNRPYVMLEAIGSTDSWHLVSGDQTANLTMPSPPANGGLVFPPASGSGDLAGGAGASPLNAPWGQTLPLRLRFDPGMQGLGAAFYRISVVPTTDGMNPSGPAQVLTSPVAWGKFVSVGGQVVVQNTSLGPQVVGGQDGLYEIPYGPDWLWSQFHNYWTTASGDPTAGGAKYFADGRYFAMVEVFDATGTRLVPDTQPAVAPDQAQAFDYLKWETAATTTKIPYADLLHLLWIDNNPCVAHIVDLRENGAPNPDTCQYMSGGCCDQFSAGFRAYHPTIDSITAPETFMQYFEVWWRQGLGGSSGIPQEGSTNEPHPWSAFNPAVTPPGSFCSMLGVLPDLIDPCKPQSPAKCTFALNLYVWAKHWNGSGRLSIYDRSDQASFSLEV
jgi:hypothetical protein